MPKKKVSKKRPQKRTRKQKAFPWKALQIISQTKSLLLIGVILILISGIYHVYEITKYSFTASPSIPQKAHHVQTRLPYPTYITIEGTDMSFPVYETVIQHGVWQIADDGASHLAISANPGENGTIIIYGHNTLNRFGSLPYVFLGQQITLETADHKRHYYSIKKTQVVNPTDTKILTSQKGEVLLLYTCYGFADLQRFVVFAYPQVITPQ